MSTFWITFVVNQALGVAQIFIGTSNLKPAMKAALAKFIAAGQALVAALSSKKDAPMTYARRHIAPAKTAKELAALIQAVFNPSFNPAQLATWAEATMLARMINVSAPFQAAGISILPQDPQGKHSGIYIPTWVGGPGGFPIPHIGDATFLHFRFSNSFEGMNVGLAKDKFSRYPNSPLYVLGELLKEVQSGVKA